MTAPTVEAHNPRAWMWQSPAGSTGSTIGRVADALTLLGVFLAPSYGLGFGGRLGFAYGDFILGLAGMARILHLVVEGIPLTRLRRHSFLGGLGGLFVVAGFVSGFVNGNPLTVVFVFTILSILGTVFLVATYGGPMVRLLQGLAAGYGFLALSVFVNPTSQGRALGFSVHPNALGHSCVMGCAVAGWLWDNASTRRQRWLWAGVVGACFLAILLSGSRGGMIGVVLAGFAYLCLRGNWRMTVAAVAGAWLVAMLLATGVVQLPEGNAFERQVTESSVSTGSNAARTELLAEDFRNIAEDPVFGLGFDQIVSIHVVYFQGWVGGGAVCALVLMGLGIAMFTFPLWTRRPDLALACGTMAVAIMWLFTNILTARDQWIFLTLALVTAPAVSTVRDGVSRS